MPYVIRKDGSVVADTAREVMELLKLRKQVDSAPVVRARHDGPVNPRLQELIEIVARSMPTGIDSDGLVEALKLTERKSLTGLAKGLRRLVSDRAAGRPYHDFVQYDKDTRRATVWTVSVPALIEIGLLPETFAAENGTGEEGDKN